MRGREQRGPKGGGPKDTTPRDEGDWEETHARARHHDEPSENEEPDSKAEENDN